MPSSKYAGLVSGKGLGHDAHVDSDLSMPWREMLEALPLAVLVVDNDVRVLYANAQAQRLMPNDAGDYLRRRGGSVLHCLNASVSPRGCGHAGACRHCMVRNSVAEALRTRRPVRRRANLDVVRDGRTQPLFMLLDAIPLQLAEGAACMLCIQDITELAQLQGFIRICMSCHKICTSENEWTRMETYFKTRWDLDFSHGYCPECAAAELRKLEADGA